MKTPLKLCLAALSAALLLTGCSSVSPDESSSGGTAPVSSAAQQPVSSSSPQGNFNPLTGEHNLPDAAVGKRPVSIMVSNIKKALPQYGLSKADICYEVLAEGGITRIMAVSSDYQIIPTVGPVRSVRDYFVDLAAPHNTIFAHFGGSPKGYEVIKSRDIDNIDGITLLSAFQQDKQLAASKGREHSFFMTASTLKKGLDKKKYTTSGETPAAFKFADSPANATMGSETAGTIKVPYSGYCTATFDYDAATGKSLLQSFMAKRDPAYTVPAANDLIDEIIFQKRIEFWGEGVIFYDLKRLNIGMHNGDTGTNAPPMAQLSTDGRAPWWNCVFPLNAVQQNKALSGKNNPNPTQTVKSVK